MPKQQSNRLTILHDAASDRQHRYMDLIAAKVPQQLSSLVTDNFFLATALYTVILFISLVTSVFSKAKQTDLGREAKKAAEGGKKQVEQAATAGKKQLDEAKSAWQEEQAELKKHFQRLMTDAEDKAHAVQGSLDTKLAKQAQELKEALAQVEHLKQAQTESASQKEASDKVHVQLTDAHQEVAAKEKQIHAMEVVEKQMQRELEHEKEMHEASKVALHEAIEKLIAAKKHDK